MTNQELHKGQRVSYEDMANPRRVGTLTGIRISEWGEQYEVTWENGETAVSDMRQCGWKAVADELYEVSTKNGRTEYMSASEFRAAMGERIVAYEFSPRLRPELRGKPQVSGLIGPCWGGEKDGRPVIRYEDQQTYMELGQ